ncbi:MAG: cupin domain-containing protein [Bacteroidota bacterium]
MKNIHLAILFLFFAPETFSQSIQETAKIQPPAEYENVHVHKVSGDSLTTTFVIFVKEKVAMHKHEHHSENVYVLEGTAMMTLGDVRQEIKPGDIIFIPKNTWHEVIVTSKIPLKVISVQSPLFDGKDRILYEKQ